MANPIEGEITCSVHLSATIRQLIAGEGGGLIEIRQIQNNTNPVHYYCTCRIAAEFHLINVGLDEDEPFPIFRRVKQ